MILSSCVFPQKSAARPEPALRRDVPATDARRSAKKAQTVSGSKLTFNAQRPGPDTKFFLVAGSRDAANFAQEILDQKRIWRARGVADQEIACYYASPDAEVYAEDKAQFDKLSDELESCHLTTVKALRNDLSAAARRRPPFLFLYVTSHGIEPLGKTLEKEAARKKPTATEKAEYEQLMAKPPSLDQYVIMMDGLDARSAGWEEVVTALAEGGKADELLLTPRTLSSMLRTFSDATPKFVTLQACHSGGFIDEQNARYKRELLGSVPNVTVLTAARFDAASFGCDIPSRATFFGQIFNEELGKVGGLPPQIDWKKLHEDVRRRVTALEKKRNEGYSNPQFLTTSPAPTLGH